MVWTSGLAHHAVIDDVDGRRRRLSVCSTLKADGRHQYRYKHVTFLLSLVY